MRIAVLVSLLAILAVVPARACPRAPTCAVSLALERATRPPLLVVQRLPRPAPISLAFSFEVDHAAAGTDAMPWIWRVLRTEVYDRMPRYVDGEAHRFSLTLSPVVVAGSFDTVPGLGVEGEF
ncbi:MAG: hypothetical protein WKG01_02750 [Kofleriaceae bacterium]